MDRRLLLGRVRISIRRSAVACERVGGRSASFISSIASPQSRGFRGLTLGRNAVSGLRRWVAATVRHRCVHLRSADSIARPLRRDAVRHRGRVAAATSEAAAAATAAAVSSAGAVVRRLVDSNGSAVKPKTQTDENGIPRLARPTTAQPARKHEARSSYSTLFMAAMAFWASPSWV